MSFSQPFERVTNKALGELLVERGFLSQEQCDQALAYARETGKRIGEALIELGYVSRDLLSAALGEQFGQRPLVLEPAMIDFELVKQFPLDFLRRHKLLPLLDLGDELIVAVGDPNNHEGMAEFAALVPGRHVLYQLADPLEVDRCLSHPSLSMQRAQATTSEGEVSAHGDDSRSQAWLWALFQECKEGSLCLHLTRDGVKAWMETSEGLRSLTNEFASVNSELLFGELQQSVRWLPDWRGKAGLLERKAGDSDEKILLTCVGELDGIAVRLRLVRPYVASPQLHQWSLPPEAFFVVIRYEGLEQLGELVSLYAEQCQPRPILLVAEMLPWLYPAALQFPLADSQVIVAGRTAGCERVVFDCPPPLMLLSELEWGLPMLRQVVIAVPDSQWNSRDLLYWKQLSKRKTVTVARLSGDSLVVEGNWGIDASEQRRS